MKEKPSRPRLSQRESSILYGILAERIVQERRSLKFEKLAIERGKPESRVFPIKEQEYYLREKNRLAKKLKNLLHGNV